MAPLIQKFTREGLNILKRYPWTPIRMIETTDEIIYPYIEIDPDDFDYKEYIYLINETRLYFILYGLMDNIRKTTEILQKNYNRLSNLLSSYYRNVEVISNALLDENTDGAVTNFDFSVLQNNFPGYIEEINYSPEPERRSRRNRLQPRNLFGTTPDNEESFSFPIPYDERVFPMSIASPYNERINPMSIASPYNERINPMSIASPYNERINPVSAVEPYNERAIPMSIAEPRLLSTPYNERISDTISETRLFPTPYDERNLTDTE